MPTRRSGSRIDDLVGEGSNFEGARCVHGTASPLRLRRREAGPSVKAIHVAVLSVFGGAVAGVIATTLVQAASAQQAPVAASRAESSDPDREVEAEADALRGLRRNQRALHQRLRALEEEEPAATGSLEPDPEAPSPEATMTREEATAVAREKYATWREVHAAEARDEAWARSAESRLEAALVEARGAAQSPEIIAVDCRTTRCKATLEWPSRGEAVETFQQALAVKMGCESAILLDQPVVEGEPYRAFAHYDCQDDRAGG